MFSGRELRAVSAVALATAGCMLYAGEVATKRPKETPKADVPEGPADAMRKKSDAMRKKMVATTVRRLGRLKPVGPAKKRDLDDFFLLGTAELTLATRHADVCFQVKQGQREVAEFLVDYILDQPEKTLRKWHVFCRLKDAQQAEQALQFTRMQYDQMQVYQAQIRKIYGAKTTRRA